MESLEEHRLIVDSIKAGDGARAEALARQHVLRARDVALAPIR
jgi:DNA-binding GntR family transcriptional regulator